MHSSNDLTQGSVAGTLLKFSVPFLLSNMLNVLYGIVDLIVVGRFSDTAGLAAVSAGSLIMGTLNCILLGLAMGSTVYIGQLIGMKRSAEVTDAIATGFCAFPIFGVLLSVVLILLSKPLLIVMNTPAESFAGALSYLRICMGGMVFTACYATLSAVLRGMGDSMRPFIFVAIASVCNIIGDMLLVAVFDMGPAGAAIATTTSQGISVVLGVIYVRKRDFPFDFKPKSFRITKRTAVALFRLGLPVSVQWFFVNASFIVIESIINGMGVVAVAATGAADRLFMLAAIPSDSFSSSISAMVAQNTGAGLDRRAKQSLSIGAALSFTAALVVFLLITFVPALVIGIFTKDAAALEAATDYLFYYRFEYLLCSIVFCLNGFINGTGHTQFTLWNGLISSFAVRIPLVLIFRGALGASLRVIGMALPIASFVQACGVIIYYLSGKWRRHVLTD